MNYDDKPVGQHSGIQILPDSPTDQANLHVNNEMPLTLADKLASKNWKTRLEAFGELVHDFSTAETNAQNDIFSKHIPFLGKYVGDSHPGAQEKALEILMIILSKNIPIIAPHSNDMIGALIDKCVSSTKPSIRSKGLTAIIAYAEREGVRSQLAQTIIDYSLTSKSPKVVVAAVQTLTALLNKYGISAFQLKQTISSVEKYAGLSTNVTIRNEAMIFFRESYKLIKSDILALLPNLKAKQLEELKNQFAELDGDKSENSTDQAASPEKIADQKESKNELQKLSTELKMENINILENYKEKWCSELLTLKKWNEKIDKLNELIKATAIPKIKNENCTELISTLKKLLNDININVANTALKAIGQLANGLSSHFSQYNKGLFQSISNKFKDKKTIVEADKCLESMSLSMKLEDVVEEVKESLQDKSQAIRVHLCGWLEKTMLPKSSANIISCINESDLVGTLVNLSDDASEEVRDKALNCIGMIQGMAGEDEYLKKAISALNQQKQDKIMKSAEIAKNKFGEKWAQIELNEPSNQLVSRHSISTKETLINKLQKAKAISPRKSNGLSRPSTSIAITKPQQKAKIASFEDEFPFGITEEEAEKIAKEKFPQNIIETIEAEDWQVRQKALNDLADWIKKNSASIGPISNATMLWLKSKLKEFKESSQNIMQEAFEVMHSIIESSAVGKQFANISIPIILDKVYEEKWTEICKNLILLISDSAHPSQTVTIIIWQINQNPKNTNLAKSALNILTIFVEEYSVNILPLKAIVNCAKSFIENANQIVRSAASALLCTIYINIGEQFKQILGDLKPAMLKSLEAEFSKVKVLDAGAQNMKKRQLKGEAAQHLNEKTAIEQLFPRINISSQITSKIIADLADKKIKLRQDSKELIEKMLINANNRIQANGLSSLIGALKGRMVEPCKNLARGFIALVGNLALGMGPGCKQYCKTIIPSLLSNLADKEANIRSETVTAINKFAEAAGDDVILCYVGPLLKKENPEMRMELLNWTLKHKEQLKKSESLLFVGGIAECLQDRSKEVRKLAEQLVEFILPQVGARVFEIAIQDFKPVVKQNLSQILQKYEDKTGVNPFKLELMKTETLKIEPQMSVEPPEFGLDCKTCKTENSKAEGEFSSALNATQIRKSLSPTKDLTCKNFVNPSRKSVGNALLTPVIINIIGNKEKREEADKTSKWILDELRPDLVEKLKKQLHPAVNSALFEMMFSNRQNKQLESLKVISEAIKARIELPSMIDILDLIFKWILILMQDQSNPTTIKMIAEMLKSLFNGLLDLKYQFMDFEAAVVLPFLIERCGVLNSNTKDDIKELIKQACNLYQPNKVCNFLVRALNSKHQKTKVECLGLIKELIIKYGLKVLMARDIKAFGKILANSLTVKQDQAIKLECVNLLGEIYVLKGEAIWGTLGELPDKVKELLNLKFKQMPVPQPILMENNFTTPETDQKDIILAQISNNSKDEELKVDILPIKKQISTLEECIENLKSQEMSKQEEALNFLNDKITTSLEENKKYIAECINELLFAFACVHRQIFLKANNEESIKHIKYFLNVTNKICTIPEIMWNSNKEAMAEVMEQLLVNLLIPGLDKIGEKKEISKILNSAMLTLLEGIKKTQIFGVLFGLYMKSKQRNCNNKLPELIVKCILRLAKTISPAFSTIDTDELLVCVHEFLLQIKNTTKTCQDDIGIRIVKTILNELIKIKQEGIWENYQAIEKHSQADTHIKKWITLMLQTHSVSNIPIKDIRKPIIASPKNAAKSPKKSSSELKNIFEGLNSKETFLNSISRLRDYRDRNPGVDLSKYFQSCSKTFAEQVLSEVNSAKSEKKNRLSMGIIEKKQYLSPDTQKPSASPLSDSKIKKLKHQLVQGGVKATTQRSSNELTKTLTEVPVKKSPTTHEKVLPKDFYRKLDQIKASHNNKNS